MKKIVPISNDIEFDTKLAEICSISLEQNYNSDNEGVSGNFIVSGEYKVHEISVNKESFRHLIPFSINFTSEIDSVDNFLITDFTYEVIEPNILRTNIEFAVEATEKIDFKEEVREDFNDLITELETVETGELINTVEDDYVLYKIHIVKEEETIELICNKYNTSVDFIKEYNNISDLKIGDKLIIPSSNE